MKEVLATQIIDLNEHMSTYSIDITLVTFNWFLTLFADAVPREVRGFPCLVLVSSMLGVIEIIVMENILLLVIEALVVKFY